MISYLKLKHPGYTRKYIVKSNVFLEEKENSFYLLGAYMTDGSLCQKRLEISSKDNDWIVLIRDIICPSAPIKNKHKSNCFYLRIQDIDVSNWMISYGCSPRKSLTLSLIKDIPIQYQPDFIRGMIDGDGSISLFTSKGSQMISVYLCSASESIIDQVKKMIPKDIICNKQKRLPSKKEKNINGRIVLERSIQYKLQFNALAAQKFLRWIYYPNHELSMPRKKLLAKQANNIIFSRQGQISKSIRDDIISLYNTGNYTQKQLAITYNMKQCCVSRLVNYKSYQ